MADETILDVQGVKKTFRIGFSRTLVEAVKAVDFRVGRGDIFGFLGPNGAGKTTTMKMIMDLIRPTAGTIRVFGAPPSSLEARRQVGYMPEHPYFHDYLKPMELLDTFGRLFGLDRRERRRRSEVLLEKVGLSQARDRALRRYSKGMLQRFGMASALIADPQLLLLDEPLSGLDPIGRKEMKDIIVELKAAGKTVLFSSHILSDIELLCDNITMIHQGRMLYSGGIAEFLNRGQREVEINAVGVSAFLQEDCKDIVLRLDHMGDKLKIIAASDHVQTVLQMLISRNVRVESVVPRSETLEELFVKLTAGGR
jgi:ABC-2 type transport system ATP-binding protein